MDVDRYLDRLGLPSPPSVTEDGLAQLIERHIETVPFENLDIPLGLGIHLETEHLFDKIVTRQRGGYCFELNGLFGSLLDTLGFERYPVLARVWFRNPEDVPALTHTFNIVKIGRLRLLADVGFGGTTARLPIPIEDGAEVTDVDGKVGFRIDEQHGYLLTRHTADGPQDQFSTDGRAVYPSDLQVANHYMATHPASHFTRMTVAGRFTPDGRTGISDRVLTIRHGETLETQTINSADAYTDILSTHFGLSVGDRAAELYSRLSAPSAD